MQLPTLPKNIIPYTIRYRMVISATIATLLLGYVVMQINTLSDIGRDEVRYNEAMSTLRSFRFDEATIEKIKGLEDPNISVEPSLPGDRTNPF